MPLRETILECSMQDKKDIKLEFKKDKINPINENFEFALDNVYNTAILSHQVFARLGYQIKIQEQLLIELKKLNEAKENG